MDGRKLISNKGGTQMPYYENPAKQTQRIEFLRNKKTGKIVKAHRHQMKAFIDSGSHEIVSLEERAEIEAAEAEKEAEGQAKRLAEADARPLYKDAHGVLVYGK
jgi:uncharacterized membrane protein YqiK